MSMRHVMAGEGASMPWVRPESAAWSGMVVCPMLAMGSGPGSGLAVEIYRLAYERAGRRCGPRPMRSPGGSR